MELTAKAAEQEQRALQLTAQAVEQVQQDADGQISDLREMLQGERDEKAGLQTQLEVRFRVLTQGLLQCGSPHGNLHGEVEAVTELQTRCEVRPHSGTPGLKVL